MQTIRSRVLSVVLLALGVVTVACGGSSTSDSGGTTCSYAGTSYDVGDQVDDSCNTCVCSSSGQMECTQKACSVTCTHDGQTYSPGTTFPSADGCNECTCGADGQVACTKKACVTCTHNGKTYQPGESFPAGDGCNDCTCQDNGLVACTLAYCAGTCTYAGKEYKEGETFPALDGCNKCTCVSGSASCTEINCPCDPAKEWYRDYVGKSPKECAVISYSCPDNTTAFNNACGCGCEQDPSCPEWFDCMPPSPCDVNQIKKQCPYSGIAY